jgi:hypothetical protein
MEDSLNEKQEELDAAAENELKKIKLSLEHGMDFSQSFTSPGVSPEIEGQFLDYIQEWENQYALRKMTTVREMAGNPSIRPASEIPGDAINVALNEVMELLNHYSIRVDTLCDVDERELYRFVVEELLDVEVNDIRVEGMMHCFTYEEFHPNHPYDIKNRCTELINHIADKDRDEKVIPWGLADEVTSGGSVHTKEELNELICRFRDLFHDITLNGCNYISVSLNDTESEAIANAFVNFSGTTCDGQAVEIKGECIFKLKCEYGWWAIRQFETPWKITA